MTTETETRTPQQKNHDNALAEMLHHVELATRLAKAARDAAQDVVDSFNAVLKRMPAVDAAQTASPTAEADLLEGLEWDLAQAKRRYDAAGEVGFDRLQSITASVGRHLQEAQILRAYLAAGDFSE